MIRERLDYWLEKGVFGLVLAILLFGPLATGAVRPPEFIVLHWMTLATLLLWLVRLWLSPQPRLWWPPICWAVTAFVVYAILRYEQADIEYVGRQELVRVLVYACLFFVILNNVARQESTQLLCSILVALAMAISLYAIYQFATNSKYVWHFIRPEGYRARGSGTYICPNHLGGFLEMLLPVGLAYTFMGRVGPLARVLMGYATLVVMAGIGVTGSRGGWIAAGLALLIFCLAMIYHQRRYGIPALVVLVILIAGLIGVAARSRQAQKRVQGIVAGGTVDDARIRLWLLKPALQMWLDHFWFGAGPGHFDYRFPAYRPWPVQVRPGHAHNDYLNTLADWGLIGAGLVAACWTLLFTGVVRTWKFVRREPSDLGARFSNRAAFVCGATIGLIAILIHSFVDFNMYIPANAILAVILMALLSAHIRYANERHWVRLGWTGRILMTCVGLLSILYLGQQGCRRAREYARLEQAAKEKTYSPALVSALKAAAEIEPANFETAYDIGEALRQLSWQGNSDYEKLAAEAIRWFQLGIQLNPYDPYNYMKLGMCLDWLGKYSEAAPYFEESVKRDSNSYYVLAHQGWHFVQTEDYATAKLWFERSIRIKWWDNPIAYNYLALVERKLKETAAPATK